MNHWPYCQRPGSRRERRTVPVSTEARGNFASRVDVEVDACPECGVIDPATVSLASTQPPRLRTFVDSAGNQFTLTARPGMTTEQAVEEARRLTTETDSASPTVRRAAARAEAVEAAEADRTARIEQRQREIAQRIAESIARQRRTYATAPTAAAPKESSR